MGAERLKSLKRGVLAMRRMLREMETELEREIAEAAGGRPSELADAEVRRVAGTVIGRLNHWTGRSFSPESVNTLYLVRRLLEEGRSETELILVVDEMCKRWDGDRERQLYLRPETLFGQHFESYLQEAMMNGGNQYV